MSFFNNSSQTPKQKMQTRNNFRLIACVALGYIAIEMIRAPHIEDASISRELNIVIAGAFLAFAIIMAVITVRQIKKLKSEPDNPEEGKKEGDAEELSAGGSADISQDYADDNDDDSDDDEAR